MIMKNSIKIKANNYIGYSNMKTRTKLKTCYSLSVTKYAVNVTEIVKILVQIIVNLI